MIRRIDFEPAERDERVGEAIEEYLALAEGGQTPEVGAFAARHPGLEDEVREALEGLALVRGLVGDSREEGGHRLEAGRQVAGYRIVGELGRGGMGVVYEAVHVALDRPVALKVLGAHAAPDSTGRRRFLNEARTAAALHHTHIVPVFDVGQVGGLCYYAMQRIEGSGLDRVLRALRLGRSTGAGSGSVRPPSNPPQPEPAEDLTSTWLGGSDALALGLSGVGRVAREAAEALGPPPFVPPRGASYYRWVAGVGRSAADALAYAHCRGVVHRDVKPSNLLVDSRGEVWVADFGLARRLSDPALTRSDGLLGTPRYMSPEQAEARAVDARTDVYSLGATLYELLTLRPPFEGQAAVELIRQILDREPPNPRKADPRIPRDLETIVLKALAKRPADRYASASEVADDLGRFLAHEPVRARRISPFGRAWRLARRNPVAASVTAVASVAVVATAAVSHLGVLHALKDARDANIKTKTALAQAEAAKVELTGALRQQRISEASYLRLSALPDRRRLGLDLLEKAMKLGPDPVTTSRLRDEAVEFLALRDVEPRVAPPAGPTQAVAFGPGGNPLATLSADLTTLAFWDPANGRRLASVALPVGNGPRRGGRGPGAGVPEFRRGVRLAGSETLLAALGPPDAGVALFDARTGQARGTLESTGHEFISVLGGASGRLVTVDRPAHLDRSAGARHPEGQVRHPEGMRLRVRLWDAAHPETPLATLMEADGPRLPMLALDPDGELVAVVREPEPAPPGPPTAEEAKIVRVATLALWSARDGRSLGSIEVTAEAPMPVSALALGPDGLLAASLGGVVRLWDTRTRAQLPPLNPEQGGPILMRFSPDGTTLALAGRDRGIELWDTAAASHVATLPTSGRVNDLAFAPRSLQDPAARGLNLAAAVDGAEAPSTWAIVEPAGVVRLPESGVASPFGTVAFGADGVLAVAASPGPALPSPTGPLRLWWPGTCPATTPTWQHARPRALTFGDRGQLIALDAEGLSSFPPPSPADLRDHPDGPEPTAQLALPPVADFAGADRPGPGTRLPSVMAIARNASGRDLAVTRGEEVWLVGADLAEPPHRVNPPAETEAPGGLGGLGRGPRFPLFWTHVALSPEANRLYLLSAWREEKLHVWALDSAAESTRELDWGGHRRVTALALSPDGRALALGELSGAVTLLDTSNGAPLAAIAPPTDGTDRVWSLAFAPKGDELAVGSRDHARLWRLAGKRTPELLVTLPSQRGPSALLAYDPRGQHLAVGGLGRPVAVWDLALLHQELGRRGLGW